MMMSRFIKCVINSPQLCRLLIRMATWAKFNRKDIFTSFNPKNTKTNRVSTQQHRNGRPTNMEVTSLLLGCQKYETPAELISKMFYFHSVSIPIIP